MRAEITLDIAQFRATFQPLADAVAFPDEQIQAQFLMAQCYISPGRTLRGECLKNALYLMTAHLMWSAKLIAEGQTTANVVTGATISKVSVTMQPPPAKSAWQFWLSTSPFGLQLWALLNIKAAGGAYVGGLPERSAFRKVGGVFF
ncbi:DUF4054 domain-containing protein [Pectobacterium parmentieri]|uniref:DUF4054 domain-containing protein n=1 Tax=Pectobacterium parmentieri TaxID=1905730 RepID=UPI000EAC3842|nr:DUF4054 domain-containing protein [Pectobacterium parmentieri]AYH32967.1 DUF4054 domain-containing protein [Pectobacterium parmentieri]